MRYIEGLRSHLIKRGLTLDILKPEYLSEIIEMPYNWKPIFKPQVTIQHKLESNIALIMALLCSKEDLKKEERYYILNKQPKEMPYDESILKKALYSFVTPFFIDSNETLRIPARIDPANSFLLFFNYCCFSMAGNLENIKDIEEKIPEGLFQSFKTSGQVNAKLRTTFMWRTPFSEIYKNINKTAPPAEKPYGTEGTLSSSEKSLRKSLSECGSNIGLSELTGTAVNKSSSKKNFKDIYMEYIKKDFIDDMSRNFQYLSYGDYYNNIEITSLSSLVVCIDNISEEEEECLAAGVLMTASLRKFNKLVKIRDDNDLEINETVKEIFTHYYDHLIDSISNPTVRYDFEPHLNKKTLEPNVSCIRQSKTGYDLLSPPCFLSQTDSMGAYKDSSKIDPEYGELIVEFRALNTVGTYALSKMEMNSFHKDSFLSKHLCGGLFKTITLAEQACKFFNFINAELGCVANS